MLYNVRRIQIVLELRAIKMLYRRIENKMTFIIANIYNNTVIHYDHSIIII